MLFSRASTYIKNLQKNKKVLFLLFILYLLISIYRKLNYLIRYRINGQKILLRINSEIELVAIESAETMISRKLFETYDYIGWILHNFAYYREEEDKILYVEFSKDIFISVFSLNILIKILKEVYDWYLSFKYYVKEVKQMKNKLKKN